MSQGASGEIHLIGLDKISHGKHEGLFGGIKPIEQTPLKAIHKEKKICNNGCRSDGHAQCTESTKTHHDGIQQEIQGGAL